jgi:hypothetical protein
MKAPTDEPLKDPLHLSGDCERIQQHVARM